MTNVDPSVRGDGLKTGDNLAGDGTQVSSAGIPQANQLSKVRQLVAAGRGGKASTTSLVRTLGLDSRHVAYYRRASEILGLIDAGPDQLLQLTTLGEKLLLHDAGSEGERQVLLLAVRSAGSLRPFWSYLEGTESLSTAALVRRIRETTGLGESTAARRAQCLEHWKATLAGQQGALPSTPVREELPARIQDLVERACAIMRHAIEHYNAFNCPVRSLVVTQHADQALELLLKANLAVNGRPDALESDDFDIRRCLNVLGDLPQYRSPSVFRRPPLLWLLHKHRNLAQHIGEPVEDDLLTLLMTHATVTFLEWARLFFGLELQDVFPRRSGLALPTLDLDLREICERQVDRLRRAFKERERVSPEQIRTSLFLVAAMDPQLSDEEKEAVFIGGTPRTPFGKQVLDYVGKSDTQFRSDSYEDLADFLEASPALQVVSRTAGRKAGAVAVFHSPKDPNAIPIRGALPDYILGDVGGLLETGLAMWRTARSENNFDYLSAHNLLRFYRSRNDSALTELKHEAVEALTLSAMKHSMPFWAWLSRMDSSRIIHWAKDRLDGATDFDLLRPLGSILIFGSGEQVRQSLTTHERDKRSTIREMYRKYLRTFASPNKVAELRRAAELTHPSEMVGRVAASDSDALSVLITTPTGSEELGSLLSSGDSGLEVLRSAFPGQADEVAALIAKWITQVRSTVAVQFALDQYWHDDPSVRNQCRQMLRKFDLVAYCPFLAT